jgi:hypothetical protein
MTTTLFERASALRLDRTRQCFAAVIGLRIALGPFADLAGQPRELFRPVSFLDWLGLAAMPAVTPIVVLQVVGVAAALAVVLRRAPRAGFAGAWVSLLLLAALRTSLGKILHNDSLLLLGTFPLLFAAARPDRQDTRRNGWPLSLGLAAVCLVYFLAGMAKLRHSGLAWVTGDNMRYVMAGAARSGKPMFPGVADFIGANAVLSHATAAGILGLELLFPVAFVVRRTRLWFAAAAVVLHVGTWLTLGLDYWLWAATSVLLLVDVSRTSGDTMPECRPSPSWSATPSPAPGVHFFAVARMSSSGWAIPLPTFCSWVRGLANKRT